MYKYTAKQISNTIKYWDNILNQIQLNEKCQSLKIRLIKVFGKEFINKHHVKLSQIDFEKFIKY